MQKFILFRTVINAVAHLQVSKQRERLIKSTGSLRDKFQIIRQHNGIQAVGCSLIRNEMDSFITTTRSPANMGKVSVRIVYYYYYYNLQRNQREVKGFRKSLAFAPSDKIKTKIKENKHEKGTSKTVFDCHSVKIDNNYYIMLIGR